MTVLRWESPPDKKQGRWAETLAELRSHPNEWALLLEGVRRTEANTAAGFLRAHGCECAVRTVEEKGAVNLYARWVGGA